MNNSKFVLQLCMPFSSHEEANYLYQKLYNIGYTGLIYGGVNKAYIITRHIDGVALVGMTDSPSCISYYYIKEYNPELFLALAAMTYEGNINIGEYYVHGTGDLYRVIGITPESVHLISVFSEIYYNIVMESFKENYRKATVEEIKNYYNEKYSNMQETTNIDKNKFSLSDLKSGYIVELRSYSVRGICVEYEGNLLIQFDTTTMPIEKFNPDLTSCYGKSCDIVAVYKPNLHKIHRRAISSTNIIIWRRQADTIKIGDKTYLKSEFEEATKNLKAID